MLETSPVRLLEEWGVPGCCAVARCSPAPRLRGSASLPGGTAVQVGWEVGDGCGFFNLSVLIFLHARVGEGSRKEKTTEQSPKNTAGQEAFLEMAHTGAVF